MKKCIQSFVLIIALCLNVTIAGEAKNEKVDNLIKKSIIAIHDKDYKEALSFIIEAKNISQSKSNQYRISKDDNEILAEIFQMEGQLLEMLGKRKEAISAWTNCLDSAKTDALKKEAKVHLKHLKD